ncbi:MAG: hypothetical protein JSV44_01665 [Candidatus Zixiibacteriota bacterium]|nr:MAG: hypothetical protein JSV44_01665 [candidate division Zixibacteria bacterium]
MSFSRKSLRLSWLLLPAVLAIFLSAQSGWAQFYDLEVLVGDTSGLSGQQNSVISIYMRNYEDTVAAFELWLILDNPDILEFQTNMDTIVAVTYWACTEWDGADCTTYVAASDYWVCTEYDGDECIDSVYALGYYECLEYDESTPPNCIDSIFHYGYDSTGIDTIEAYTGNLDTVGTLVGGWELVESRSLSGYGNDIKITAATEAPPISPPFVPGVGYPQYGDIPLIKILGDIREIPDTDTLRTVKIKIQSSSLNHFSFSDENGDAIGINTEEVEDTLWWECTAWADPPENTVCISWKRIASGPSDSFEIDTILVGHLDTSVVFLKDGSLTVELGVCGDANGDTDINLLDILYLISDIYSTGPDPVNPMMADCDCDGLPGANINLLDILYLIAFIYFDPPGPDPCCEGF